MILNELLQITIEKEASDLHLTVGVPPIIRVSGELVPIGLDKLNPYDTEQYVNHICLIG